MNFFRSKISLAVLLMLFIGSFVTYRAFSKRTSYHKQIALAQENRKAFDRLMQDLYQVKVSNLKELPPDGQWHQNLGFYKEGEGDIDYRIAGRALVRTVNHGSKERVASHIAVLQVRRKLEGQAVIEVRLTAESEALTPSHFKVRLKD